MAKVRRLLDGKGRRAGDTRPKDARNPRRIPRAIDSYAEQQGETRSKFLARAALDRMRRETASPS